MLNIVRLLASLRSRAGNAAVEFALIAPILSSALVGMADLGIGLYERMEVENAAQAGAQYAIAKGWNASAVATAVTSASSLAAISAAPAPTQSCGCASGATLAAAACGSTCPGGALAGTYVTVNAQAQYATIFDYPGFTSPMTLTAQAVVRIQ
jgi:Flp pilus assembly protein TadG